MSPFGFLVLLRREHHSALLPPFQLLSIKLFVALRFHQRNSPIKLFRQKLKSWVDKVVFRISMPPLMAFPVISLTSQSTHTPHAKQLNFHRYFAKSSKDDL